MSKSFNHFFTLPGEPKASFDDASPLYGLYDCTTTYIVIGKRYVCNWRNDTNITTSVIHILQLYTYFSNARGGPGRPRMTQNIVQRALSSPQTVKLHTDPFATVFIIDDEGTTFCVRRSCFFFLTIATFFLPPVIERVD